MGDIISWRVKEASNLHYSIEMIQTPSAVRRLLYQRMSSSYTIIPLNTRLKGKFITCWIRRIIQIINISTT